MRLELSPLIENTNHSHKELIINFPLLQVNTCDLTLCIFLLFSMCKYFCGTTAGTIAELYFKFEYFLPSAHTANTRGL